MLRRRVLNRQSVTTVAVIGGWLRQDRNSLTGGVANWSEGRSSRGLSPAIVLRCDSCCWIMAKVPLSHASGGILALSTLYLPFGRRPIASIPYAATPYPTYYTLPHSNTTSTQVRLMPHSTTTSTNDSDPTQAACTAPSLTRRAGITMAVDPSPQLVHIPSPSPELDCTCRPPAISYGWTQDQPPHDPPPPPI